MQLLLRTWAAALATFIVAAAGTAFAQTPADGATATAPTKEERGLRGNVPIPQDVTPGSFRANRTDKPVARNYAQQPPVIPHSIKGYNITRNFNKCLACHATAPIIAADAPKPSKAHFRTREGQQLTEISARRYFCTACHVPQTDADPLVGNTYKPAT